MKAHPLATTRYLIQPGDTIIIQPKQFLIVPLPLNKKTHVVAEGESLQDLLVRFKLTPDEIIYLNQDLFLQPGQLITIEP